ncbi:TPA: hypothetical protein N0F65_002969 [Lagenidium giganteum]|uniref:Alpha N-terminal protein methyltransferase 1 n=1 Tax=Lagenidium giganteum TaxID=4803 RepID=A0AAV2YJ86_9STRA|nr:TPA: hypothetical protein N0F65_002969 [Lagenidium giganteum]
MVAMKSTEATAVTVAPPLIQAERKLTSVAWEELRQIAEQVQKDIEYAGFEPHSDYECVADMWEEQLYDKLVAGPSGAAEAAPTWYSSAGEYWEDETNCPPDDQGVLGGYAVISPADVAGSREFLAQVQLLRPDCKRDLVVDCGAGVGRVSKQFLLPEFAQVDLVEQSPRLLQSFPNYLGKDNKLIHKVRNLYCMGLQEFHPEPETYDVIWIQWVALYLTDVDFVHFLQRCQRALKPGGWICVKENVLLRGCPYEVDKVDSSITRSDPYYKSIFRQAGTKLLAEKVQEGFLTELYPVKMVIAPFQEHTADAATMATMATTVATMDNNSEHREMKEVIRPTRKHAHVDWEALRSIADVVQKDLDDSHLDDHNEYDYVIEMWEEQLGDAMKNGEDVDAESPDGLTWYTAGNMYWDDETKCSPDDNGVLGGFPEISPADIADSRAFIEQVSVLRPLAKKELAADCGAGVGRVSKFVLLPAYEQVDLIEQSPRLLQSAARYMGKDAASKVRKLYCMGLQEFHPEPETYDIIWIQWVLPHLMDADFISFLQRCQRALKPHGWIGVKENVILSGLPYEVDKEDTSLTRSEVYYKSLFRQAGLELITEKMQDNFPEDLYPVKMYALA